MKNHKIIVCGATGNQGGAVAAALLRQRNWTVTALTRDPGSDAAMRLSDSGAEVVKADLLDMPSLLEAFSGAYGVFSVTQPWLYTEGRFDTKMEIRQAKNIIWACRETGISRVVLSSVLNMDDGSSGLSWVDSKAIIEEKFSNGLPDRVIVRPALFMENLGTQLLKVKGNKLNGRFASDAKVPFISLQDIGDIVAKVFGDFDSYRGKVLNLVSDLVSGREIASLMSAVSGKKDFHYEAVNELVLRLFWSGFFRMRRFFELQGRLLELARLNNNNELFFFSERMPDYIAENAAKLFPHRQ